MSMTYAWGLLCPVRTSRFRMWVSRVSNSDLKMLFKVSLITNTNSSHIINPMFQPFFFVGNNLREIQKSFLGEDNVIDGKNKTALTLMLKKMTSTSLLESHLENDFRWTSSSLFQDLWLANFLASCEICLKTKII